MSRPQAGIEDKIFDVAVVGYGPTGATLANLLAGQGLQVLVIDREATIYNLPRAVHFDDETMRVFQTVGVADELSRYTCINPGMKFQDSRGRVLLDWPRDQSITSHGWNASYRLHQPDLERLLREQLQNRNNVQELPGCQVEAINENSDHVALGCEDKATSRKLELKSRYVVGCDGANSLVRQFVCDGMKDFGFCERWLVVDLMLERPRPDLGDHSIQFCDPQRPMTYCRSPGRRRRWEITVLDGETDEEISSEKKVWELLSRWITPKDAAIERCAIYTFRSAIARQWHKGRLCIAGDAAHLTPPFMGQGMCTGIRDAANLAWKLSLIIQNGADGSILHTYEKERSPHAQAYIETAIRLGGLINTMDQASALQMANNQKHGNSTIKSIQPKLGASHYLPGLSDKEDHPVGRPFLQVLLNENRMKFDDVVGFVHTLITRRNLKRNLTDCIFVVSAQDYTELNAVLDELNAEAVWVRPDRYIAALANNAEELLTQMQDLLSHSKTSINIDSFNK